MRRFRYVALALAAIVAPLTFVGCGDGNKKPSAEETEDAGHDHAGHDHDEDHEHHDHEEHEHNE